MSRITRILLILCLAASPLRAWEPPGTMQLLATDGAGRRMLLCDFASAGTTGTSYASWIPVSSAFPPLSGGPYSVSWLARWPAGYSGTKK